MFPILRRLTIAVLALVLAWQLVAPAGSADAKAAGPDPLRTAQQKGAEFLWESLTRQLGAGL